MRWLTVGVPGQDTSILLELVGAPMHDESTAAQVRELVAKGALGGVFLLSDDVHATYAALRDAGVEITQEPVEQPYGTDFGIRDPFGNHIRINQPAAVPVPTR
jgi:predicted enzyme related to lactoylglutathione lyase